MNALPSTNSQFARITVAFRVGSKPERWMQTCILSAAPNKKNIHRSLTQYCKIQNHMSHEKKTLAFHVTGCLIGILVSLYWFIITPI